MPITHLFNVGLDVGLLVGSPDGCVVGVLLGREVGCLDGTLVG